jgi:hypothetical protein
VEVERNVGFVSDDPAIVAWRYVEEVTGAQIELAAVVHPDFGMTREDQSNVLDFSHRGARYRTDVH